MRVAAKRLSLQTNQGYTLKVIFKCLNPIHISEFKFKG